MRTVVIEGVNGAGKSSVARRLQTAMESIGRGCLVADPAAYGEPGRTLRQQLMRPSPHHSPDLDAVLFSALRAEGARRIIDAAGSARVPGGTLIVLERWSSALRAYGVVDHARPELISELEAVLVGVLSVDVTVLLDVSGETAWSRIAGAPDPNRFESRGRLYLEDVASAYRRFSGLGKGMAVVDASGSEADTFGGVTRAMSALAPELTELA
jgi:dTMP kinase